MKGIKEFKDSTGTFYGRLNLMKMYMDDVANCFDQLQKEKQKLQQTVNMQEREIKRNHEIIVEQEEETIKLEQQVKELERREQSI